jgi:dsRNA-specific ribonuclease
MSASSLASNDKILAMLFSNSNFQNKIKQLQKRINYTFKNPSLLHQALTRQNAIQEQHPDAYIQNFEALEFVGDAALKHGIARLLYLKYDGKASESQLHKETVTLIANEGVMPQIARNLKLDELIIKGKGELIMTSKILADSLEALLGAISIDCGDKQKQLLNVIKRLWQPYLDKKEVASITSSLPLPSTTTGPNVASSSPSSQATNQFQSKLRSVPANYQRVFSGISPKTSIVLFQKFVLQMDDVNYRNVGKAGNPALMMLLKKKELRKVNELPKIKALLEHGANWKATNNKGETAEDFALLKHGGPEAVLKMIQDL